MTNKSESIGKFATALCKAQNQLPAAAKSSKSHYGSYADLPTIQETLKEPLAKHGLSYVQMVTCEDNIVAVETMAMHESGEWLSATIKMTPSKKDPQGIGSCITYALRYSLKAFFGVQTCDDDDGDAASNVGKGRTNVAPKPSTKTKEQQFQDAVLKMVPAFKGLGIEKEAIPVLVGVGKFSDLKPEHIGELKKQYAIVKEETNA